MIRLQKGDVLLIANANNFKASDKVGTIENSEGVEKVLNFYLKRFNHDKCHVFLNFVEDTDGNGPVFLSNIPKEVTFVETPEETSVESAFTDTELKETLEEFGAKRVFIGGFGTEDIVKNTVKDAVANGFHVVLLVDGILANDLVKSDVAFEEMRKLGVVLERSPL